MIYISSQKSTKWRKNTFFPCVFRHFSNMICRHKTWNGEMYRNYVVYPDHVYEKNVAWKRLYTYPAKNQQNCEKIHFFRVFFVTFRTSFVDIKLETVKFTVTTGFALTLCTRETLLKRIIYISSRKLTKQRKNTFLLEIFDTFWTLFPNEKIKTWKWAVLNGFEIVIAFTKTMVETEILKKICEIKRVSK